MGLALGELSEPQRSEVRAHAMECDECRTELRRLERLLECAGRRTRRCLLVLGIID